MKIGEDANMESKRYQHREHSNQLMNQVELGEEATLELELEQSNYLRLQEFINQVELRGKAILESNRYQQIES